MQVSTISRLPHFGEDFDTQQRQQHYFRNLASKEHSESEMANRQQQLAIQKQISLQVNKNHLTRIPSFSDWKDAASSFSMSKNLTDKPPQVKTKQLTQSPSTSDWKSAADSFSMLINMTNKPQEPYSSEVPSPRRLAGDSGVWLLPRKPEPPSSDQPFPKRPAVDSEFWLGTSKPIMQAPTKNPNQRHAPPTSGEDHAGIGGSRPPQFFEHEPSSSERPFPKRPSPNSEAWPQQRKPIMLASTKNANQRCAPLTSGEDHAGCGGSRPYQFPEHDPSSSEQPFPKHPTPDSEAWPRPRKPIMQAPTKVPNQSRTTPTSAEDQEGCGGSRPHQLFEFEPSSSTQPFPTRSTSNSEAWKGPKKPEPKPFSSEQQFNKRPTANSEAWSGPRKKETSSGEHLLPKRPTTNSEAWLRTRNTVPFPSQTPNQRRETPPGSSQPYPNSRPTNNFPNPNSRPSNIFPSKFHPGVKRKAPDTDPKYRPSPQPPVDCITNIIKSRVDDYFCELCQVNSSSALTLRMHLRGRKHRNNAKYCRQKMTSRGGVKGTHRCDVCHISCTDRRSLTMHLKGKKHLDRLQKVENGQGRMQKSIRCELCMVSVMNEDCFAEHVRGSQHAVQLELANRGIL